MPQGLQCWDENAQLIVDLTDSQLVLFASVRLGDVIAPDTPGQFFSSYYTIPRSLTLAGIHPDDTIAYLAVVMTGSEYTTTVMTRGTATVVAANTYVLTAFESVPSADTLIHFYKFR